MKLKLSTILASALLGLAARFNLNVSAPHITYAPKRSHKRSFRTGIKGVANTNNTRFGAALKAHFERTRAVKAGA